MRILRTLAATLAVSAILLGAGATSVLAASDPAGGATTARYTFGDEWCFEYATTVDCSVTRGTLSVTSTPEGRDVVRIHHRIVVKTYDASGVQVGASRETSYDRTISTDEGQISLFTIEHGKAVGDGYDCVYGYQLKIVDYELVSERYTGPGCN